MGKNGQLITDHDDMGGVFAPVPGKLNRPAYTYGPEGAEKNSPIYTCPTAAIPLEVWQVLSLWNTCRLLSTLPVRGALSDQPYVVQRYFPVLEAEYRVAQMHANQSQQAAGAAMAMGAMTQVTGR